MEDDEKGKNEGEGMDLSKWGEEGLAGGIQSHICGRGEGCDGGEEHYPTSSTLCHISSRDVEREGIKWKRW